MTAKKTSAKKTSAKKTSAKKTSAKKPESKVKEIIGEELTLEIKSGCTFKTPKGKEVEIDSVWASAGMTLSTGDYESARFDFGAKIRPLDEGTELEDICELAWDVVKTEVSNQARQLRSDLKARRNNG